MQERRIKRTEPVFCHLRPSPPVPDAGTPETPLLQSPPLIAHEPFPLHPCETIIESTQGSAANRGVDGGWHYPQRARRCGRSGWRGRFLGYEHEVFRPMLRLHRCALARLCHSRVRSSHKQNTLCRSTNTSKWSPKSTSQETLSAPREHRRDGFDLATSRTTVRGQQTRSGAPALCDGLACNQPGRSGCRHRAPETRSAPPVPRESGSEPHGRSILKAQAGALRVRLADDENRQPRRHRPARLLVGERRPV
jgi:hypothetical protein